MMLTFFRRIRKGLLGSGQARKYMLYAVGEILLVMIGILLALQVNNWNEWRKDRNKEIGILKEFNRGFLIDIENLAEDTLRNKNSIILTQKLIETLQNQPQIVPIDSILGAPLQASFISINTAVYELLKSKGIDLISDDSLRQQIFHFYEAELDWYEKLQKLYTEYDLIFYKYYSDMVYRDGPGPNDWRTSQWEKMKLDHSLVDKLKDVIGRRKQELNNMVDFINLITFLNKDIELELSHKIRRFN